MWAMGSFQRVLTIRVGWWDISIQYIPYQEGKEESQTCIWGEHLIHCNPLTLW